jgi:sialic acid synthase SpsE
MSDKRTVSGDVPIGYDKPVFVIAEAGINHGGDLDVALSMALIAKECGASAVKYQTFLECELAFKNITYKETRVLKEYCDSIDILFLSTPHTVSAIDALDGLVPMFKVASPRLFDHEFLKKVIAKNKPIIISVNQKAKNTDLDSLPEADYIFMHTVCKYPADDPNFLRMEILKACDTRRLWGYSDHTKGIHNCLKAVTKYGVCLIEKHFKLNNRCVDVDVSVFPEKLEELCVSVKSV